MILDNSKSYGAIRLMVYNEVLTITDTGWLPTSPNRDRIHLDALCAVSLSTRYLEMRMQICIYRI